MNGQQFLDIAQLKSEVKALQQEVADIKKLLSIKPPKQKVSIQDQVQLAMDEAAKKKNNKGK